MAIINKETIISAFDDKMTLLQWLKKLEKVLDTSTLASIKTIKVANTQYKIVLSFEDDTTIESDIIQLQSEIAGIQLQNGHLIFTLLNGNTIDAGLIDVSNLGNTTIYGTFEVADGDATFGANVEVDGTLKVNSTLQVGNTTTNDDELAKLPRTLLTPLETPSEQVLVGIDTANGQNILNVGQGLQIEGNAVRVGGIVKANEIIENMTGYKFYPITIESLSVNIIYAGVVKTGNKVTFAIAAELTRTGTITSASGSLGYFEIPSSVGSRLYPTTSSWLDFKQVYMAKDYNSGTTIPSLFVKENDKRLDLKLYSLNATNLEEGVKYYLRYESTFLLSDNLAG